MKEAFVKTVLRPLLERVGTMIAMFLIARGLDSDVAATITNGVVAALFVVLDLVVSRINRGKEVDAAYLAGRFPDQQDRF